MKKRNLSSKKLALDPTTVRRLTDAHAAIVLGGRGFTTRTESCESNCWCDTDAC